MADRELKKLSRKQLLELLLKQTVRADQLQYQLDQAKKKLQNRIIAENEAGSIAEASLKLNGVFQSAQAAADQYLDNVKRLTEEQIRSKKQAEAEYLKRAEELLDDLSKRCKARDLESKRKAAAIIAEAEERAKKINTEAETKLREIRVIYRQIQEYHKNNNN